MNTRYYIMIAAIAAIFCTGSLFMGMDTKAVARRCVAKQKQEVAAINEQLKKDSKPATTDSEVVLAGY